jgi:hypothetical protein
MYTPQWGVLTWGCSHSRLRPTTERPSRTVQMPVNSLRCGQSHRWN